MSSKWLAQMALKRSLKNTQVCKYTEDRPINVAIIIPEDFGKDIPIPGGTAPNPPVGSSEVDTSTLVKSNVNVSDHGTEETRTDSLLKGDPSQKDEGSMSKSRATKRPRHANDPIDLGDSESSTHAEEEAPTGLVYHRVANDVTFLYGNESVAPKWRQSLASRSDQIDLNKLSDHEVLAKEALLQLQLLSVSENVSARLSRQVSALSLGEELKAEKHRVAKLESALIEKDSENQALKNKVSDLQGKVNQSELELSTSEAKLLSLQEAYDRLEKAKIGFEHALQKTREELVVKGKTTRVDAVKDFCQSQSLQWLVTKKCADQLVLGMKRTLGQLKRKNLLGVEVDESVIEIGVPESDEPVEEENETMEEDVNPELAMAHEMDKLIREEFYQVVHSDEAEGPIRSPPMPSFVPELCETGNEELTSAGINLMDLSFRNVESLMISIGSRGDKEILKDTAGSGPGNP